MVDSPAAIAAQIQRLKAVVLEAEQRYYDAVHTEDPAESSANSDAASAWLWALDALNDFRRTHLYPKPDHRRPGFIGRAELSESGVEAP